ncbi:MAG: type II toxin-antitoxin system RelE/ParE family toxin [Flavobacteriales bacterium]|nr:type II toxin-antitoxin system RelE/ParE family toxin [Flavobacteriales bacterium]
MAKYKLSEVAKADLIRIYNYGIKSFGPIQAENYFDAFYRYFDQIAENPFAFESVDHIRKGYRRCVCGVDSIFYRINHGTVEIMAIIGRQDLENLI